jgi:hypothetical protein
MDNVIYTKTIVPMADSPTGEDLTLVVLTKEVNALLIWFAWPEGAKPIEVFKVGSLNQAIERAVDLGRLGLADLCAMAKVAPTECRRVGA